MSCTCYTDGGKKNRKKKKVIKNCKKKIVSVSFTSFKKIEGVGSRKKKGRTWIRQGRRGTSPDGGYKVQMATIIKAVQRGDSPTFPKNSTLPD